MAFFVNLMGKCFKLVKYRARKIYERVNNVCVNFTLFGKIYAMCHAVSFKTVFFLQI